MNKGIYIVLVLISSLWACKPVKREKLLILCTTSIIADPLSQVLGSEFEVVSLMSNGVDPHSYKPSIRDLEKIESADFIVMNGFHLEGKLAEILTKYSSEKMVFSMSDAHPKTSFIAINEEDQMDPHFWFDPRLWKDGLDYVSKEIISHNKQVDSSLIIQHKQAYFSRLDSLYFYGLEALNEVPVSQRILVTNHDAFGYFARAFSWEVHGLQGVSTVLEPGLKDLNELVSLVTQKKVKAIFVESNLNTKSLEALIKGCQARGHDVKIGGRLFADCPGMPGTHEASYIGMMNSNIQQLRKALK